MAWSAFARLVAAWTPFPATLHQPGRTSQRHDRDSSSLPLGGAARPTARVSAADRPARPHWAAWAGPRPTVPPCGRRGGREAGAGPVRGLALRHHTRQGSGHDQQPLAAGPPPRSIPPPRSGPGNPRPSARRAGVHRTPAACRDAARRLPSVAGLVEDGLTTVLQQRGISSSHATATSPSRRSLQVNRRTSRADRHRNRGEAFSPRLN
jgi:hypothetical protein